MMTPHFHSMPTMSALVTGCVQSRPVNPGDICSHPAFYKRSASKPECGSSKASTALPPPPLLYDLPQSQTILNDFDLSHESKPNSMVPLETVGGLCDECNLAPALTSLTSEECCGGTDDQEGCDRRAYCLTCAKSRLQATVAASRSPAPTEVGGKTRPKAYGNVQREPRGSKRKRPAEELRPLRPARGSSRQRPQKTPWSPKMDRAPNPNPAFKSRPLSPLSPILTRPLSPSTVPPRPLSPRRLSPRPLSPSELLSPGEGQNCRRTSPAPVQRCVPNDLKSVVADTTDTPRSRPCQPPSDVESANGSQIKPDPAAGSKSDAAVPAKSLHVLSMDAPRPDLTGLESTWTNCSVLAAQIAHSLQVLYHLSDHPLAYQMQMPLILPMSALHTDLLPKHWLPPRTTPSPTSSITPIDSIATSPASAQLESASARPDSASQSPKCESSPKCMSSPKCESPKSESSVGADSRPITPSPPPPSSIPSSPPAPPAPSPATHETPMLDKPATAPVTAMSDGVTLVFDKPAMGPETAMSDGVTVVKTEPAEEPVKKVVGGTKRSRGRKRKTRFTPKRYYKLKAQREAINSDVEEEEEEEEEDETTANTAQNRNADQTEAKEKLAKVKETAPRESVESGKPSGPAGRCPWPGCDWKLRAKCDRVQAACDLIGHYHSSHSVGRHTASASAGTAQDTQNGDPDSDTDNARPRKRRRTKGSFEMVPRTDKPPAKAIPAEPTHPHTVAMLKRWLRGRDCPFYPST